MVRGTPDGKIVVLGILIALLALSEHGHGSRGGRLSPRRLPLPDELDRLMDLPRSSEEDEDVGEEWVESHSNEEAGWGETRTTVPSPAGEHGEDKRNLRTSCVSKSGKTFEHRSYPRSWEYPGFEASLPREWDWRNVSGVNFCSPTRNQHIPVYCGSCWVFGTLGALNDRFNIARRNRWPMTQLSPQEIINCNGVGSCQGGEPGNVFEHAKNNGLVEEGCNNYKAINEKCTPYTRCGTCWPDTCYPIKNYTTYHVTDYGRITGREAMMAEIHNRGPIACSIGATQTFDLKYTGGIYEEMADEPTNHIVSVTGWAVDKETNVEYWVGESVGVARGEVENGFQLQIVRNSWGEAWGEMGWFRIVTSLYKGSRGDQYNLGIERDCYFADPDVSNLP